MIDVAAELTSRMVGLRLTSVQRREGHWIFGFSAKSGASVSSPWRILVDGRIVFGNEDDGQMFGLPAPVNGEKLTRELLGSKSIQQVTIRDDTGDLSIHFTNQTILEVINMSGGYEGWQISADDLGVIGMGGGELAITGYKA
jgi:hypothetical protein